LGLPDLIFTSWVMGRKQPLAAYGPHGLQNMTDHLVAAWAQDIEVRTNGLEKRTPGGYRVDVHEIRPGVVYDSGGVRVAAFVEVGQLAARLQPKLLILTHIIRRGATDEELLANVRKSFGGRAVVGHDLDRY